LDLYYFDIRTHGPLLVVNLSILYAQMMVYYCRGGYS
jgi:hypothetical protein